MRRVDDPPVWLSRVASKVRKNPVEDAHPGYTTSYGDRIPLVRRDSGRLHGRKAKSSCDKVPSMPPDFRAIA